MHQRAITWALLVAAVIGGVSFVMPGSIAFAVNITEFRDTISDSGPGAFANHTLEFTLTTDIGPGSVITITPPPDFTTLATSTFAARNVELLVDGNPRSASSSPSASDDGVSITGGSPGQIVYTLNSTTGINAESRLTLRVGNHTTFADPGGLRYSSSTGTTTVPADIKPIRNSTSTGDHDVAMRITDGGTEVARADFLVFITDPIGVGPVDTTEEIPPLRFNGAPTSTVGGTTLSVEISLETDEFSVCKYSTTASTTFSAMSNSFDNTGLIFHSSVVSVTPGTVQTFYVRCVDDEGNFNSDDFLIEFSVSDQPTGSSNTEGDVSGDGSGEGDEGTGDGGGSGGVTGEADGELNTTGGDAGGGGSGGGGGGGSGGRTGDEGGGGFESSDGPYRSGDGRVVISGFAYPDSDVTFLIDGEVGGTTNTDRNGEYEVTLDEIARGVYTFGVYATGPDDVRSSTFSTSFTVTGARTSALSNINVPPSIAVSPDPADPGDVITFSGYAISESTVTIENQLDEDGAAVQTLTASSSDDGAWSVTLDSSDLTVGTYRVRGQAQRGDRVGSVKSDFSEYTYYGVGQEAAIPSSSDLNTDGSVNLTDFSILLFWWNSDGGDSNPPADINQDGTVNLTDFSILLFNWTG